MSNLKQSPVTFDELTHSYMTPDGKYLSGITGMIDRHIFGGKFASVSREFLAPYAERGHKIHTELELYFKGNLSLVGVESEEANRFINWCFCNKCFMIKPEYTVSDEKYFATQIDNISEELDLYDYKTGKEMNLESVSWQLSICAYLFKKQNGFDCGKLYGVHLYGDICEVIEVERKSDEAILGLFSAEIDGGRYMDTITDENAQISKLNDVLNEIKRIKQQADEAEARKTELLAGLEKIMDEKGLKSFENDLMKITKVAPSTSVTLDTKALKSEHPEIAKQYERTTEKKGFVKITLRGNLSD